jgi:hypothetical protein
MYIGAFSILEVKNLNSDRPNFWDTSSLDKIIYLEQDARQLKVRFGGNRAGLKIKGMNKGIISLL